MEYGTLGDARVNAGEDGIGFSISDLVSPASMHSRIVGGLKSEMVEKRLLQYSPFLLRRADRWLGSGEGAQREDGRAVRSLISSGMGGSIVMFLTWDLERGIPKVLVE